MKKSEKRIKKKQVDAVLTGHADFIFLLEQQDKANIFLKAERHKSYNEMGIS
ncbi:hypothetical protein H3S83_08990 [Bartonella sp. W8122]|uniref:hypothetical protein n=1 Tax=Bartonella sp. W8122 TaxID=2750930 RepID=UPI0018DC3CDC|nr:hypothetical protein [Bartonella sp. W8122]MBI0001960.1 hypothetical protein [Bartonella sp. W8122]